MVDAREVVGRQDTAAIARDPLDAIGSGRRKPKRHRHDRLPRETPEWCPVLVQDLRQTEPRQRCAHGTGGDKGGRLSSSSRRRCSSCAILSSASSSSSRVTSPTSRKTPASLAAKRSPTLESPRHTARNSSARAFASSRPSRWTAYATLLAGSAMRTCAAPLPAALPLRFGGNTLDCVDRRQVRCRFRSRRFLRLFEDHFGSATVAVHLHVLAA